MSLKECQSNRKPRTRRGDQVKRGRRSRVVRCEGAFDTRRVEGLRGKHDFAPEGEAFIVMKG
jgi:hypothetical protein